MSASNPLPDCCAQAAKAPSLLQLAGVFSLVAAFGALAARLGVLRGPAMIGAEATFISALVIGLVAASTSCVAVVGGLVLSYARGVTGAAAFVLGRVLSYGLFGGLLGALGRVVVPPPAVTGGIIVLAALGMLVAGLKMIGLAPAWLLRLSPRLPQALTRFVDGRGASFGPFLLGAATFFIPCGFTQSFQLYAFTTGDFARSALLLSGFAVGTAPALIALGAASGAIRKHAEGFLMRLSGAFVIVLGLWNFQNGLTLAGYPVRLPDFAARTEAAAISDPNVTMEEGVQVIRMRLSYDPAYLPSDAYTVKAGRPVRIEVRGIGTGCRGQLLIPRAGVALDLVRQTNVVEFTPKRTGAYVFSCAMGMFPGVINAVRS